MIKLFRKVFLALKKTKTEETQIIHESNIFLETILENIPAMIFIKEAKDLRFKLFNKAGEDLLGFPRGDLLGKNDYDFFPKEQADFFTSIDRNVLKQNKILDIPEEPIATKYKGVRWLHTKKIPLMFVKGKPQYLLGISLDITEEKEATDKIKKFNEELEQRVKERTKALEKTNLELLAEMHERAKAEEAMRASEEKYRFLADAIPQIIWTMDPEGNIHYGNKYGNDYTGITIDQNTGWEWTKILHPDDYEKTVAQIKHSLQTGDSYEAQYRLKRKDGVFRWFLGRAVPMKNSAGKIIKWFGTSTEIHDYKLALESLASTKEELQNINQKLSVKNFELTKTNMDLDNFVYTASHDLKAPVINIEGLIKMLSENLRENCSSEEIEFILAMINNSVKRFQQTIVELTEISKIQRDLQEDFAEINIDEYIGEAKFAVQNLITESNAIIKTDTSQYPVFHFSKVNFRSLINNLLTNAIKYRSPDRQPLIEIKTYGEDGFFVLEVKDNGLGVREDQKNKMFGMFKRFHDHVEGTGVGLYIVKRIVENSKGKIEVDSSLGKGSVFKIYLRK